MTDLFSELKKKDIQRRQTYTANLDFYNGVQWEHYPRRGEKQLTFNYVKVFIDKLTSYLMHGMSFAVDPMTEGDDAARKAALAEKAMALIALQNNLELLDYVTEVDCAILGDGCFKVTWSVEEQRVRVTAPDVQGIYAWWMPDDPSRVYQVVSQYGLPSGELVTELWTPTLFEYYINRVLQESRPNPYGMIPFIIYPNLSEPKQFWGKSDVEGFKETQRELNRSLSQLSHILELSGNPIAVLENIEEAEDIAVKPGAVWEIPSEAKAYLLDLLQGGGIKMHLEYIELLYRILHDTSESPKSAYGRTERDLSGVALEIEMQPLLQKVRRKQLIRTGVYRQRSIMFLHLLKVFAGIDYGPVTHRINWGSVLPMDTGRMVENETKLVEKGIHTRRTAMDLLGIKDPAGEFEKWLEERARIMQMNQKLNVKPPRGESE